MIPSTYESRGMGARIQGATNARFGPWKSVLIPLCTLWPWHRSAVSSVRYAEPAQVPAIPRETTPTYIESKPAGGRAGARPLLASAEAPTSGTATP